MTKKDLRIIIIKAMIEIAEESSVILVEPITESTELLQSGLDSMGFAILVAKLDEDLGYDPFTMMSEPVYPTRFGEFLDIYFKFSS